MDRSYGGPDIDFGQGEKIPRRSVYLRHAHEKLVQFVQIFDGPKVSECYMREESIQPHQALALANSKLTFDQAGALAETISEEVAENDAAFVEEAFLHVLNRAPSEEEVEMCAEFLRKPKRVTVEGDEGAGNPEDAENCARRNLVLVLFNHNDFVTIR